MVISNMLNANILTSCACLKPSRLLFKMPKRIAANLKDDFTLQGLIDMGSKFHQNIQFGWYQLIPSKLFEICFVGHFIKKIGNTKIAFFPTKVNWSYLDPSFNLILLVLGL